MHKVNLISNKISTINSFIRLFWGSFIIFTLLFFSVNCSENNKRLVIKGFYIEMPVEEAYKKVLEICPDPLIIVSRNSQFNTTIIHPESGNITFINKQQFRDKYTDAKITKYIPFLMVEYEYSNKAPGIFPFADKNYEIVNMNPDDMMYSKIPLLFNIGIVNNKVKMMSFTCVIFNACDMSLDSFAKEIKNKYGIPKLTTDDNDEMIFESELGFKVKIYTYLVIPKRHAITIMQIQKKSERKFN